jgi:hypothetical protein
MRRNMKESKQSKANLRKELHLKWRKSKDRDILRKPSRRNLKNSGSESKCVLDYKYHYLMKCQKSSVSSQ